MWWNTPENNDASGHFFHLSYFCSFLQRRLNQNREFSPTFRTAIKNAPIVAISAISFGDVSALRVQSRRKELSAEDARGEKGRESGSRPAPVFGSLQRLTFPKKSGKMTVFLHWGSLSQSVWLCGLENLAQSEENCPLNHFFQNNRGLLACTFENREFLSLKFCCG